jgi:uncharacterized protein (DUF1330 family)
MAHSITVSTRARKVAGNSRSIACAVLAAPPGRVIINEWDSIEQAQAFYKSKAYTDLVPQRDKAMKVNRVYLVETIK